MTDLYLNVVKRHIFFLPFFHSIFFPLSFLPLCRLMAMLRRVIGSRRGLRHWLDKYFNLLCQGSLAFLSFVKRSKVSEIGLEFQGVLSGFMICLGKSFERQIAKVCLIFASQCVPSQFT